MVADAIYGGKGERGVRFDGLWLEAPVPALRDRVERRHGDASDADAKVIERRAGYDIGVIVWHRLDASGMPAETVARAELVLEDNPKVVSRRQEP